MKQHKSKSKLPDKYINYAKYRWEYLRRNKKYIKGWENLNTPSEEEKFCIKWKIFSPLCPTKSYDDLISSYDGTPIPTDVHYYMFHEIFPEFLNENMPISIIGNCVYDKNDYLDIAEEEVSETGKLKMEIDLNYSKKRLLEEFTYLLDRWSDFYKSMNSESKFIEKKKQNEKKYHFENFDTYLEVYDLRQKKTSWGKIQERLKLNSLQTARNNYKSACALIEKGIDLYVK